MKRNQIIALLFTGLFSLGFIYSCKKDKEPEPPQLDAQTKQFNDDSNNYKTEWEGLLVFNQPPSVDALLTLHKLRKKFFIIILMELLPV